MEKGKTAYELALQGLSWIAVAEVTAPPSLQSNRKAAASAAANIAKKFARKEGLPWPIPALPKVAPVEKPVQPDNQQRAYEERVATGDTWPPDQSRLCSMPPC
jgi:hypothetical protein